MRSAKNEHYDTNGSEMPAPHKAPIGVDDLLRVVATLHPRSNTIVGELAELFGLVSESSTSQLHEFDQATGHPTRNTPQRPDHESGEEMGSHVPPTPRVPSSTRHELMELSPATRVAPPRVMPLEELLATSHAPVPQHIQRMPISDPAPGLFEPTHERALLSTLAASRTLDGDLDSERVVTILARSELVLRLPRLPLRTTRRGLQVLVDLAPTMELFQNDIEHLMHGLRRVVGSDGVDEIRFRHHPDDPPGCGLGPIWTWGPYRPPPPPGRPVLVISDFGQIAGDKDSPRWIRFARRLGAAGCPIVGLVPLPPRLWRRPVADAVSLVSWDRTTTAGTVAIAVHRASTSRP